MSTTPAKVRKAIVSSTALDLPDHRKQVQDACLRQSFHPVMMEHLPASDAEAISASMAMVDEAEVYIGVYGFRYGYVPAGYDISVTEMEYNRAVERKIPRLIFIMHEDHPVKRSDVETGPGEEKLRQFKARVGKENIVNFFQSPEELRSFVINSLSQIPKDPAEQYRFHYVSNLTEPPEPYIAHPYTLSQTTGLIGRNAELNLLTDWITGKRGLDTVRIFNVIAIGGMGKSALTWKWFNELAPLEWKEMAGRFWWSFYESDAYFENFVIRALAYVSRRPMDEIRQMPAPERETELLQILDREPHLLVLDGLERMLIAYARMDAAHLQDDEYDKYTANYVARAYGLPESAAQSFTGEFRLRKTADPRAGQFLRRLSRVRASRVLVSSRLYPFDLQTLTGDPAPHCTAIFLKGLRDDDALTLWRHFGCTGGRDELLRLFHSFESHPLVLQILAGEIARFRPAPGDFDRWHLANPDFNPFEMKLVQAKTHILKFAFQGLSEAEMKVLQTIAAFRMPTQYDTLLAVCSGEDKPCPDSKALDEVLSALEERGILSWDRPGNRYDLHPVVRGVAWTLADKGVQQAAYASLQGYFEAVPKIENYLEVNSLEDLTPAIELYHALIGLRDYEAAYVVFFDRIDLATHFRLGASRQRKELLEKLFPDGLENPPRLSDISAQGNIYNRIALAFQLTGEPLKGTIFFKKQNEIQEKENHQQNFSISLGNLSSALCQSGRLMEAAEAAQRARDICQALKDNFQKSVSLQRLGFALAAAGRGEESLTILAQSKQVYIELEYRQSEGLINAFIAQQALWYSKPEEARFHAERAWELAHVDRYEADFIRAACRQGQAALQLGKLEIASERLHHGLTRARAINRVEEELPALIALAELARRQNDPAKARELLDDVWEYAERGPYPLLHADACNVLCQIERDAGNTRAAIEAATQAYRHAWCEGPPWAYHYGLENAKKHLRELGAPEPEMPAGRVGDDGIVA